MPSKSPVPTRKSARRPKPVVRMDDTPTPPPSPPPPRHDDTSPSEPISTSPDEGDVTDDENDPVEVCAVERHPYHNYSKASLYQMWQSQKAVVVDLKRIHTTLRKAINDKDRLIGKYDKKIQSYEKKLDRVDDLQQTKMIFISFFCQ